MQLVLDSNEYLLAVGPLRNPACERLLEILIERAPAHELRVPRLVISEVRRNIAAEVFRDLLVTIQQMTTIDEDLVVPFELAIKYEAKGLKPADAFIAAYAEWVGADALVSENRHFLIRRTDLPFRVLTADQALRALA